MRTIDYSADIVAQLQDACDFATEPRELERLCGNAMTEIILLRETVARLVAYKPEGPTEHVHKYSVGRCLCGAIEDPLAWSRKHGVEEF